MGVLIETTTFKTLKRPTWIPKKKGLEDDFPFHMDNLFPGCRTCHPTYVSHFLTSISHLPTTTPGPDLPSTEETLGAQGLLGCLILFAVWLYQLAPLPKKKRFVVYLVYPLSYILENFSWNQQITQLKGNSSRYRLVTGRGKPPKWEIGRYTIEKLCIYAPQKDIICVRLYEW